MYILCLQVMPVFSLIAYRYVPPSCATLGRRRGCRSDSHCCSVQLAPLHPLLCSLGTVMQAHAITTLAALAAHSPAACQQLLEAPSAVTCLGSLARHPSSSALRLQAAAAVAALVAAAHSGALEVAAPLLQVRILGVVSIGAVARLCTHKGCSSSCTGACL
jgi:hypothetical protein